MKLLFGTAGIPLSTEPRDTLNGIAKVRKLDLDAMELEFVHSVNISEEKAPDVKAAAKKQNVTLTCHGQYYINLNSDKEKTKASGLRILKAARIANLCGAQSVTFHAGFYMKQPPNVVYDNIRKQLVTITKTLKDDGNKIWIRPEISGKPTQFGNLEELTRLSEELEQVLPCIDFAHLHARTGGKYNTYEEFASVLGVIERRLGKSALHNMHMHVAGIAYSDKGEKNHLMLKDSDLKYKELVKAWKDFKTGGVVICESPNMEEDAKLLKRLWS